MMQGVSERLYVKEGEFSFMKGKCQYHLNPYNVFSYIFIEHFNIESIV